jgi:HK97 family phage major capsid protein
LFVLAHVDTWYRRTWCFYDAAPGDIKALNEAFEKAMDAMKKGVEEATELGKKAHSEIEQYKTLTSKTNEQMTEIGGKLKPLSDALDEVKNEFKSRLLDVEQKLAHRPGGGGGGEDAKSVGQMFAESEQLKQMLSMKVFNSAPVSVKSLRGQKTLMVNASGQNQPLVPAQRMAGVVFAPEQRLTVRDLIPVMRTASNSVEWVKELVFTNNAGPPESGITFQLNTTAVITLAHWIPASRQVLADAPYLQDYIDMRLRYGLKLEEEDELLNGDGTAGTLNGLVNQATAFSGGATNQTAIDTLLKAMTQARLSFYEPNGVVMHPQDWTNILLQKDTTGRYLFGDPHTMDVPRIWGKPVVETPSQTQGQFILGAFDRAAQIVDREDASVRISDQHADFFTRNLVAILCEERLALLVTRPAAIVKGALSNAG